MNNNSRETAHHTGIFGFGCAYLALLIADIVVLSRNSGECDEPIATWIIVSISLWTAYILFSACRNTINLIISFFVLLALFGVIVWGYVIVSDTTDCHELLRDIYILLIVQLIVQTLFWSLLLMELLCCTAFVTIIGSIIYLKLKKSPMSNDVLPTTMDYGTMSGAGNGNGISHTVITPTPPLPPVELYSTTRSGSGVKSDASYMLSINPWTGKPTGF